MAVTVFVLWSFVHVSPRGRDQDPIQPLGCYGAQVRTRLTHLHDCSRWDGLGTVRYVFIRLAGWLRRAV